MNWLKNCDQIVLVHDITNATVSTEFSDDFLYVFLFPLLLLPPLSFLVIICLSDIFHYYDENANMFYFIVLFTHDEEDAQVPHT